MAHPLLDILEQGWLVVPYATAALADQGGVETPSAAIFAIRVVPHFLLFGPHQRNGQSHFPRAPDAPDAMDVVLVLVRQGKIDDERKPRYVDTTGSDILGVRQTKCTRVSVLSLCVRLLEHDETKHLQYRSKNGRRRL